MESSRFILIHSLGQRANAAMKKKQARGPGEDRGLQYVTPHRGKGRGRHGRNSPKCYSSQVGKLSPNTFPVR